MPKVLGDRARQARSAFLRVYQERHWRERYYCEHLVPLARHTCSLRMRHPSRVCESHRRLERVRDAF